MNDMRLGEISRARNLGLTIKSRHDAFNDMAIQKKGRLTNLNSKLAKDIDKTRFEQHEKNTKALRV